MSISSLFQFIIGFFLGIIFFTAGIAGGAYLFLTRVSVTPDKHIFAEEKPAPEKTQPAKVETKTETENKSQAAQKEPEKTTPEETKPDLPEGAYMARVTWSTGLSLRAEPSKDAQRIGGIGYNWEIIILSTSNDKRWQKVRIPSSGQEGWVKAGNVAKVDENEE